MRRTYSWSVDNNYLCHSDSGFQPLMLLCIKFHREAGNAASETETRQTLSATPMMWTRRVFL